MRRTRDSPMGLPGMVLLLIAASSSLSMAPAAEAARAQSASCLAAPQASACAAYRLPTATAAADVAAICAAAPHLTGCSLRRACAAAAAAPTGGKPAVVVGSSPAICDPFTLLATLCTMRDAPAAGCRANYGRLCAKGSAVRQCREQPGLGGWLVTAADASKWAKSVCDEMEMDGCERCAAGWKQGRPLGADAKCDPFAVYGWLCAQMPDMWQCIKGEKGGDWDVMCRRDPKLFACTGDVDPTKVSDQGAAALASTARG